MRLGIVIVLCLVALGLVGWLFLGTGTLEDPVGPPKTNQGSLSASNREIPVVSHPAEGTRIEDRGSAPVLIFSPEKESVLAYRFNLSAKAQIDIGLLMSKSGLQNYQADSRQSVQTVGEGELKIKFYPGGPDSWDVAGRMTGLDYRINNQSPYWLDAAGYPFTFRMNAEGILDRFEFTKGTPVASQEFVRDILTSMQVVLPRAGKYSWATREIDTTGRYRAEYVLKKVDGEKGLVELKKKKKHYLSTRMDQSPLGAELPNSRPQLERAQADIVLPLQGGWLQSVQYEEVSRTLADGVEWSAGDRRFIAERVAFKGEADFPENFARFRERLNSDAYLDSESYRTDPTLDRLGAGLSLEEALGFYQRLLLSENGEERILAEKFLVNYLRQHPLASFDLVYLLDTVTVDQIDDATQLVLWRLLTEAGHREAQQALAQAASGQGFSELTQWRAVSYAHDFARPEAELVEELWRLHNMPGGSDPELQDMALYALGSLGGKENISEEMGERLHQQLTAELVGSTTVQDQALALAAIGNTGSPEMIDAVTPYLSSPEPEVRAAACDAMRRMQDPAAADLLIQQYQRETSTPVREVAAKTLARLPANTDSAQWARQEVLRAPDAEAQLAMVRILGESLGKFPENESALRQLLEQNPARQVKKEVYRYIAPQ